MRRSKERPGWLQSLVVVGDNSVTQIMLGSFMFITSLGKWWGEGVVMLARAVSYTVRFDFGEKSRLRHVWSMF